MHKWDTNLQVGLPLMDVQHKKIFEISGILYQLSKKSELYYKEITSLLKELHEYIKFHFEQEEALFIIYGSKENENHMHEHRFILNYIESVSVNFVNYKSKSTIYAIVDTISNWFFDHIIMFDCKMLAV